MFKCALVCTDFSDGLQRLINFVPDLLQSGLDKVVFFHNVSLMTEREIPKVDEDKIDSAKEKFSKLGELSLPEGKSVEIDVRSGRATDNILKAARDHGADIIFFGAATRSLLTEKIFGSTTTGVAKQLEVPFLILRPQLVSTYREQELALRCQNLFTHLLIPYDGSNSAQLLLSSIEERAEKDQDLRQCTLCWVIDDCIREELRESQERVQQKLDKAKAGLASSGVEVFTEIRQGDPQPEVLKSADVNDISAIAVCSGKSKGILKWSLPSFTSGLLRSSWHPVIHFPNMQ